MKLSSKHRKISTFILLLVLSFVLGSALATKVITSYYQKLFDEIELKNPAFNLVETVNVLKYLRNGQIQKAIDYEEWRLDDNLMILSNYMNDSTVNNIDVIKYTNSCIKSAYKYRHEHPSGITKAKTTKKTIVSLFDKTNPHKQ